MLEPIALSLSKGVDKLSPSGYLYFTKPNPWTDQVPGLRADKSAPRASRSSNTKQPPW